MSKSIKTIRLFSSPLLERLTRTHSLVAVSIFIAYSATLFVMGVERNLSVLTSCILALTGLLFFTWVEYQIHRKVFHLTPSTPRRAKLQFAIHGVHHDLPEDKSRLAMPLVLSLSIASALVFLSMWAFGTYAFAFLSGFMLGYAAYLLVHYMVHAYAPPKNKLSILWRHHHIHHYRDAGSAFGVSSPLWDYVYNTMPKKKI